MSHKSVSTTMVDVARRLFGAVGRDIVWAVVDSGIDATHAHFRRHRNLELPPPLYHEDFTDSKGKGDPLLDQAGHGTHIAGIIAGEIDDADGPVWADVRRLTAWGTPSVERERISAISGMAPQAKIVSLKVLDESGNGRTSACVAALNAVQQMNGDGARILIHGVTIAGGWDFDPEWFGCGQSPICVEVDRLVKTGVVVVVAAGNTGYGIQQTQARGSVASAIPFSINDPGNSELAITVGSTHRERPQEYGVSWFSSRGPTADGRAKPDLLAPGERIVSCRSARMQADADDPDDRSPYFEQSGTAMAAAHASGIAAAFLSARREAIGDPLTVKETLRRAAVDLRRSADSQGAGLINLLHALRGADSGQAIPVPPIPASRAPEGSPTHQRVMAAASPDGDVPTPSAFPPSVERPQGVTLFCSYSHADVKLRRQFERSIVHLLRDGRIDMWHDGEILPGSNWRDAIDRQLASAQMIVLLVSPDFMQSPFIHKVELTKALERHEAGKARVIPIVLRPIVSLGPLSQLEALPDKARAVTMWKNRDSAWVDVARGVERALNALITP